MSRWLELRVAASAEAVEAVSEILSRVGHGGGVAVEEPLGDGTLHLVKAYIPHDHVARARVRRVREALGRLEAFQLAPLGPLAVRRLVEEDWLSAWRAHYRPLVVGRFLIKPSWVEADPSDGRIVVELDPGMAFGTGLHPTTQQMLLAMSGLELAGRTVLDVGTGSGILALAASAAGAARVVALDVDAVALRTARENLARARDVAVLAGSAADVGGEFDVVLANIVAKVIAEIAHDLRARTAAAGACVVAGLVEEAEPEARRALERAGFHVGSRDVRGDWVSLILRPA